MFIIDITYTVSLEKINECMKAHVEYLDKYFASNKFLIAGRKKPRTGGIIVAIADSKEEIERIAKEDPFYTNNLADIKVIEFSAGKKAESIDALLANTFK
jgi:uncharacterized protein YciI